MRANWTLSSIRPTRLAGTFAVLGVVLMAGAVWSCRHAEAPAAQSQSASKTTYYCPMHPHYKSDKPGDCPICSMKLVPLETSGPGPAATSGSTSAPATSDPGAPASGMSGSSGQPPTIRISPERQQQIGVKFAEVQSKAANVEIRAVGRVAYDETRIAHVHTKVSGWIDEVFVNFVGAPVRKGQPLFTIYSPDLVAGQEEYLQALHAAQELGNSSLPRVAQGSENLLKAARRRLELWDMTAQDIAALEKSGKVARTVTVHSPVTGIVTERAAYHHGRTVTPDLDLYMIVDLSEVWVVAQVYEYEVAHVRVGQSVEARLPYDAERAPLRGRVAFVAPFLDPKTRTVEVRMDFENSDLTLKPEMFVNVTLHRDLGQRLIVPKDAVMNTGERQYVFVDKGEGYLEPREVKAGPETSDGLVVGEGLAEGDRVVTAANFILDSESRLKGAFDTMGKPGGADGMPHETALSMTIDLTTDPTPAKVGKNKVRVKVMDASGQPIADADVDIRLSMPAMGSMAPMESKSALKPAGNGYAGEVDVPMAWSWETTVTARKGGQVIGTAQTTINAR